MLEKVYWMNIEGIVKYTKGILSGILQRCIEENSKRISKVYYAILNIYEKLKVCMHVLMDYR